MSLDKGILEFLSMKPLSGYDFKKLYMITDKCRKTLRDKYKLRM
jgi:hypothetical protein